MARDYENQIQFVGVAGLDTLEAMEGFVDRHGLEHVPHAATEDGELWVRFDIAYQPAWIIADADGEVVLSGVRPSPGDVRDALEQVASG